MNRDRVISYGFSHELDIAARLEGIQAEYDGSNLTVAMFPEGQRPEDGGPPPPPHELSGCLEVRSPASEGIGE